MTKRELALLKRARVGIHGAWIALHDVTGGHVPMNKLYAVDKSLLKLMKPTRRSSKRRTSKR
jgi:hypothetical protein